jgi:S-methylmethionine-dependent homocysteine/selenocysteine methylase
VQSLRARPILLDGALGTELELRGAKCTLPLWTAETILESPEQVRAVHRAYVEAGAHVITAATFRTTRWVLSKVGMAERAGELTRLAVEIARGAKTPSPNPFASLRSSTGPVNGEGGSDAEAPLYPPISAAEMGGDLKQTPPNPPAEARGNAHVLVAGSLAPLEDCFQPELAPGDLVLRAEHRHNAQMLADAGVDIILVETQNSLREARIATHFARQTHIPVWTSFIVKSATELLNGDSLREATREVVKHGAAAVLINCTSPQIAAQAVMNLSMHVHGEIKIGVYPNAVNDKMTPDEFAEWGMNIQAIADIVGGCCGIGPEHIGALAMALSSQK